MIDWVLKTPERAWFVISASFWSVMIFLSPPRDFELYLVSIAGIGMCVIIKSIMRDLGLTNDD